MTSAWSNRNVRVEVGLWLQDSSRTAKFCHLRQLSQSPILKSSAIYRNSSFFLSWIDVFRPDLLVLRLRPDQIEKYAKKLDCNCKIHRGQPNSAKFRNFPSSSCIFKLSIFMRLPASSSCDCALRGDSLLPSNSRIPSRLLRLLPANKVLYECFLSRQSLLDLYQGSYWVFKLSIERRFLPWEARPVRGSLWLLSASGQPSPCQQSNT